MYIQLTNPGIALLAGGPFALTEFRLGDASGYTPNPSTDTDIRGNLVWSGTPGPAFPLSGNIVRYSMILDRSVGDFAFGELGLFVGSTLVALGVSSTTIEKNKTLSGIDGNFIRIDSFLSMVGTNYEMWLNFGNSDNKFNISDIQSVDQLPAVHDTLINSFVVGSVSSSQLAFLAYTDRSGLWAFDQYKYSTVVGLRFNVVGASALQVTIAGSDKTADLAISGPGHRVLQFTTGQNYSLCRNIASVLPDLQNDLTIIGFETPLAQLPSVGDEFMVLNRDPLATTSINVPIATAASTGIISVGSGLSVTPDGETKVDRTTVEGGLVYSIIGRDVGGQVQAKQGDVQLLPRDIPGVVQSVNNQLPDASGNVSLSTSYVLPTASPTVKGGVRVTPGSGLKMTGEQLSVDDQLIKQGVTSVNGNDPDVSGNLQIPGLIFPTELTALLDFDEQTTVGLYWASATTMASAVNGPVGATEGVLEVLEIDGSVLQRWTESSIVVMRILGSTGWSTGADIPSATTSRLGGVVVGTGLNVDGSGLLSTDLQTVNSKSPVANNIDLTAADVGAIATLSKGAPNGVAPLSGTGTVPEANLPSFIIEVADYASLPSPGVQGKLYVTVDTNQQYRWDGTDYEPIVASVGDTDSVPEGATNLYFTVARVRATVLTGLSLATNAVISATDTVLGALGKLQAQITGLGTSKADNASPTFTGVVTLPQTTGQDNPLTRVMFKDTGYAYYDAGTSATLNYVNGANQKWSPTGSVTLSITNWCPTGNLGELLIEGQDLGSATIDWGSINWVLDDGTTSTTFADTGVVLQASGTDFILVWTRDEGSTIYGKVMR